jgi:hypothetical protein
MNLLQMLSHGLISCICLSCISTIPKLISHFNHDHFTLAQTMQNSMFGQALITLDLGWKLAKKQASDPMKIVRDQLEL